MICKHDEQPTWDQKQIKVLLLESHNFTSFKYRLMEMEYLNGFQNLNQNQYQNPNIKPNLLKI